MNRAPLNSLVRSGSFGPFHSEGHEILRRLSVTVRDQNWREVAPNLWASSVDAAGRTVNVTARHTSAWVDFEWRGILHVDQPGHTFTFAFEGKALQDMAVCRLGLIVLHPVEELIDAQITADSPQCKQSLTMTRQLVPQPIVDGLPQAMTEPFSSLTIERPDVGRLQLHFVGDLFELEDQRNWGDASFKTYCTPLRLGFPRSIKKGTAVAHRVEVRFTPSSIPRAARTPRTTPSTHQPAIGRPWNPTPVAAASRPLLSTYQSLSVLTPLDLNALKRALQAGPSEKIELCVEAEPGPSEALLTLLKQHESRIVRILLYGGGVSLPSAAAVAQWRSAMGLPLFAATRGYFVEFNRAVPFDLDVDGIAFPLTATVHGDDATTILENAGVIQDIADTARTLTHLEQIAIAPLALYFPAMLTSRHFPPGVFEPWFSQTLAHAKEAGITSISLGADVLEALRLQKSKEPS